MRALLFDMDGTVAETESLHLLAVKQIFKDLPDSFLSQLIGISDYEVWEKVGGNLAYQDFIRKKDANVTKLCAKISPLPGLIPLLKRPGYKKALVSSSTRKSVMDITNALGISGYFDVIISGDDVKEKKPSPEPYLLALGKLGCKPQDALVFEDSKSGLESARKAGIKTVAVLTYYDKKSLKADYHIKDYLSGLSSLPL